MASSFRAGWGGEKNGDVGGVGLVDGWVGKSNWPVETGIGTVNTHHCASHINMDKSFTKDYYNGSL